MIVMSRYPVVAGLLVAGLALTGCGGKPESGAQGAGAKLDVVAGFYPIAYVTERVGGDRISVHSLAKPGAEPHDLELTAQETAKLRDADLVVHLREFQPDVDAALDSGDKSLAFDVANAAKLDLPASADEHAEEAGHSEESAPAEAEGEHGEEHDPHFWLDPLRLADVGDAIATRLAASDATGASAYAKNATTLRAELEALDREFATGLATCADRRLVTSHAAFGYLARKYKLTQTGIAGISPESEPSGAEQARIADLIRAEGVKTVFTEPLVDSAIADTVAKEAGVGTAVLDPIEGIDETSKGKDYPSVMRSNLVALREGLSCT